MNSRYVVDASVAARFYLTDEEAADKAAAFFDGVTAGRVTAYAPTLILYEVPRALHRAARRGRFSIRAVLDNSERFCQFGIRIVDEATIPTTAIRLAETYRCNFYDACYLALAELLGLPFLFADDKLERQLAARIDYALPLAGLELA